MKMKNNINKQGLTSPFPDLSKDQESGIFENECKITPLPGPFGHAVALTSYTVDDFHRESEIGVLIRRMKSEPSKEAADRLAAFIIKYLENHKWPQIPDVVLTIPDSVIDRPFSPVEYLYKKVAVHFDWSVRTDIIRRIRPGKPQRERSFEERLADTEPRYGLADPEAVRDKHLLLLDDIYATGRSLIEAAELIRAQSPKSIMALALVKLRQD